MCKLRYLKVQAARDAFYMHTLLEAESELQLGRNKILELITVPRNRRALVASEIVMFMQQFCGVNVIAYYSSQIFLDGGFSPISALSASLGFGLVNWLFAIPAVYTIDTFGRRNLLLTTFPLVSTSRASTCPFYPSLISNTYCKYAMTYDLTDSETDSGLLTDVVVHVLHWI